MTAIKACMPSADLLWPSHDDSAQPEWHPTLTQLPESVVSAHAGLTAGHCHPFSERLCVPA